MSTAARVLEIPAASLTAPRARPLVAELDQHLALKVTGVLSPASCASAAAAVYAAREAWISDFDGVQFSLGRAWYTHLEQDRARAYFEGARDADALVERQLPGYQARMRELLATVVGDDAGVTKRRAWCGPGVHVFPAGACVSREGGDVHFDTEGLTPAHRRARAPALTCVLMLQPAESGGELRLWDVRYEGSDDAGDVMADAAHVDVAYGAGDLVVIDSYRLHQIRPFVGARDRVSMTAHAARVAGTWESWF